MRIVLVAHTLGEPIMGGDRARLLLKGAFEARGATVEVATYDAVPRGRDVYVFETPTTNSAVLDADGRASVLLRHGDCQMASLAPQLIDTPGVTLVTPTDHAYRCLGWRVERRRVQWMALEEPQLSLGTLPLRHGSKVLHVRAFDFQKDTLLAIEIAKELPEVEFVFRVQPGATKAAGPVPHNITLLPPTSDQAELWNDIGCLLVTSRWESFCMTAYEALGRGIPVICHDSLGAVREWYDSGQLSWFLGAQGAARRVHNVLHGDARDPASHTAVAIAQHTHRRATMQFSDWMDQLAREIRL